MLPPWHLMITLLTVGRFQCHAQSSQRHRTQGQQRMPVRRAAVAVAAEEAARQLAAIMLRTTIKAVTR